MKPGRVPLERALSKLGIASRTEARAWILEGRVRVAGKVVTDPLRPVIPERTQIDVDGEPAKQQELFTIALHKPRGLMTTRSDEKGRPTVYSLLTDIQKHLVPVGRLDYATSGLILLTNDTRFSAWITEPAHEVPKLYLVSVRGEVSEENIRQIEEGIRVDAEGHADPEGELLRAQSVKIQKSSQRESHLTVELIEGKNREIRRIFKSIGHEVIRLKRISFGGIELGDLETGKWREVTREELQKAFPGAPLKMPTKK